MDELNDIRVVRQRLRGNELLVLDDPSAAWRIDEGSLALFSTALDDGTPAGPRTYYFTSGVGDVLFGLPAPAQREGQAVIAVALEDTLLRRASREQVGELLPAAGRSEGEAVNYWAARWTACAGPIEGVAAGELPGTLATLRGFHEALLERLQSISGEAHAGARDRLVESARRSSEAARRAVGELAGVLSGAAPLPAEGSELFLAASAVTRLQDISLCEPRGWEAEISRADPVRLIARASHVRTRSVLLPDAWWTRDCGPLLGFTENGHRPVALLPRSSGSYELYDPAAGTRRVVDAQLAAGVEPRAHVFYRPLPEDASRGMGLLRFALKGRSKILLTMLATGVAATLLGMFTPQATALLVDRALPDADRRLLFELGLALAAAAFGGALFRWSQGIAMMRLETGADTDAQAAVWDRLLKLQLSFFRRFSSGELQSRVTAISQIRTYLSGATLRSLFSGVILFLNLGLLLYYSPALTLIAVAVAAISASVTVGSGMLILRCYRRILALQGHFFGLMVQLVNGVAKLRVAAAEERAFARWATDFARLLRLELRQLQIRDTVQVINLGLSTLSSLALFAGAASLVGGPGGGSGMTTGTFLAFFVAYGTFIGAISSVSNTVTDVLAVAILRERARPILEAVPEVSERKSDPGRLDGALALEDIVFRYREDGPVVLNGLTLNVEAGQFAAIVGPSGSGKSTLFRLALGFETPQSGKVLIDGQDLAGLDVHAVRRQMGIVLQSGRINADSIFENIVTGTQVPLEQAWDAARATGFADEIEAMPMGMHTIISEGGTNLSGGQRQRLLLTRALVHKPRILLLDEATSALDNQTQAIVIDSLNRLSVTRIVIAHRLSTIREADRIYVIDGGRIVEQGSFDELATRKGLFARLMARQMT